MPQTREEQTETHFMLRKGYWLIECAWCKRRIRWQPKKDATPGGTSHGICQSCMTALLTTPLVSPIPPPS